ncbi:hypothetical protein [Chitinophaga sancti]|uniref:hypothetical protein n=1 Tax=Chitinophaga sancti TaxID=1004 RepID=UPI003F7AE4CF
MIEPHCKEVEQMLESPPRDVYRWGNSILFIFAAIVCAVVLLLKFPVTLDVPVTLHFDAKQHKWINITPLPGKRIPGETVILSLDGYPVEKNGFVSTRLNANGELELTDLLTEKGVRVQAEGNVSGNAMVIIGYQSLVAKVVGKR